MSDTIIKERNKIEHGHKHSNSRGNVLSAGWKTTVKVVALPGNPIEWRIDSKLKARNGYLVFNKSDDQMPKKDHYLIEFDLQDFTGLNLQFQPNPMDAFWVAMGDDKTPPPCPRSASYSDQIYAIGDDVNGQSLTIRHDDRDIQYFAYSLGLIGDPDGTEYRCDPIGDNQDGGTSRYD